MANPSPSLRDVSSSDDSDDNSGSGSYTSSSSSSTSSGSEAGSKASSRVGSRADSSRGVRDAGRNLSSPSSASSVPSGSKTRKPSGFKTRKPSNRQLLRLCGSDMLGRSSTEIISILPGHLRCLDLSGVFYPVPPSLESISRYFSPRPSIYDFLESNGSRVGIDSLSLIESINGNEEVTCVGVLVFMEVFLGIYGNISNLIPVEYALLSVPSYGEWCSWSFSAKWAYCGQLSPLQRAALLSFTFGMPHELVDRLLKILGVGADGVDVVATHVCVQCQFWYISMDGLVVHMELMHRDKYSRVAVEEDAEENREADREADYEADCEADEAD